ncbi:MAG: hypothetical protein EZS28_011823 [Streblomastix strix]|uniref:Uncharacterized protein n=1 Tax=Streblomastix strix TaxID=222440 RepID=A0A5J4WCT9_9EUKA|nr:MAG: hypothetical protein EZS28_011823 [Streblomastix strix]
MLDKKLNISDQIDACTKQEDDALLLLKADKSELIDAYNKTEVDAQLDDKLNISDQIDACTKQEDDALLLLKTDKTELIDAYNKTEVDAQLDDKLNISDQIDAYTKQEDDVLLLLKADKAELADYVDLTYAQTINRTKQFNSNVNAAALAKTRKNDASILFAGGDDTLVSSLVSLSQLQKVRDIASVDKQVMDYWWEGTGLRVLEMELPDIGNVITIIGVVTGGVEISEQKYYNNSVVCAGCDVKAISDIIASVDLSSYFSKTNTDTLLDDKLNVSDQIYAYLKTQDDALLLSKADKTQLIDAYTKEEADNLLKNKANQSITYTKTETDQLISQIDVGDVDQSGSSFIKSGADDTVVLLGDGEPDPERTDEDYISLSAVKSQFVSSIYYGSINGNLTANQFIKSGGTDKHVLLAIGTTKAISEFGSGSVDDSNFVKKSDKIQVIQGVIRRGGFDCEIEEQSEDDDDYIIRKQVLLANGATKPLSEFAGGSVDDSNYVKKT